MEYISLAILLFGAIFAALLASFSLAGAVHVTSRTQQGYFHLIFYAMLAIVALSTLLSGRTLSVEANTDGMMNVAAARDPIAVWAQRLVSILALTVAGERIASHWLRRDRTGGASPVMLLAFIVFWMATVALPALFGARPFITHDYFYPLVIGIAAVLASPGERDMALRAARNALLLFCFAGLALIPVLPGMVLDPGYSQGFLPGVPRMAGLAAHAVSLGLLSQVGLICLLARPFDRVWLNRLAWAVGLTCLFLAQSKTAWISFIVCFGCIALVRFGPTFNRRLGNSKRPEFGIAAILAIMAGVVMISLVLIFGDVGTKLNNFFNSSEGAQLTSLTGRDQIWAIAWDEWRRNPIFGYGPTIWDSEFRAAIGMPNASHAHSQFMDTLSRSGTIGATALVLYAMLLLGLSIRHAGSTGGLSLALFMALALLSVTEVPLHLFGYGVELLTHVLLLMTLAAAGHKAATGTEGVTPLTPRTNAAPRSGRKYPRGRWVTAKGAQ